MQLKGFLYGKPQERVWAIWLWSVLFIVVATLSIVQPRKRSLYPTYATAGADWLTQQDAYRHYHDRREPHLDQYRYSPLITAMLVPWSLLPESIGGALWKCLGGAAYLVAATWWWRVQTGESKPRGFYYLLLLPLALESMQNGQVNLLVIALILTMLAAAQQSRWWLSAVALALAVSLKIYPLAVGLLLWVAEPRKFTVPMVTTLLAAVGIPFVLQDPTYVWTQYKSWYWLLTLDEARRNWSPEMAYRDLWLLLQRLGLEMEYRWYQAGAAMLAAGCACLIFIQKRQKQNIADITLSILGLGCGWLVLCGPSIESSTFVIIAPVIATRILKSSARKESRWAFVCIIISATIFGLCVISGLFPWVKKVHALGIHAVASLFLFMGVLLPRLSELYAEKGGDISLGDKAIHAQ